MRLIKIIVIIFGTVLFTTACVNPIKRVVDPNAWKKEVLWAQECGLEGLACCVEREPVCSAGLFCCTDPNDAKRKLCSSSCACGDKGRFCCATEPKCGNGLACHEGNCQPCGGSDQPCCPLGSLVAASSSPGETAAQSCQGDLICYQNQCLICGQLGHPCCPAALPVAASSSPGETAAQSCQGDTARDTGRAGCLNNVCVRCGFGGNVACPIEPACNYGFLLNSGSCLSCGEYNQPCCNTAAGKGYDCNPQASLTCQLGFCATPN